MRTLCSCAVAVALLMLAGCGDSHESLAKEHVEKMEEWVTILKSVKDESSARAAAKKLEVLAADMKDLKARMDKVGKLTAEQEKALKAKYEERTNKAASDMMSEIMRLAMKPELTKALEEAMSKMEKL